jgi:hypothetical protein
VSLAGEAALLVPSGCRVVQCIALIAWVCVRDRVLMAFRPSLRIAMLCVCYTERA